MFPNIFSYRKKNNNKNQKLERFRRTENRRLTGKTHNNEHEDFGENSDITFEVKKNWKSREILMFDSNKTVYFFSF